MNLKYYSIGEKDRGTNIQLYNKLAIGMKAKQKRITWFCDICCDITKSLLSMCQCIFSLQVLINTLGYQL